MIISHCHLPWTLHFGTYLLPTDDMCALLHDTNIFYWTDRSARCSHTLTGRVIPLSMVFCVHQWRDWVCWNLPCLSANAAMPLIRHAMPSYLCATHPCWHAQILHLDILSFFLPVISWHTPALTLWGLLANLGCCSVPLPCFWILIPLFLILGLFICTLRIVLPHCLLRSFPLHGAIGSGCLFWCHFASHDAINCVLQTIDGLISSFRILRCASSSYCLVWLCMQCIK